MKPAKDKRRRLVLKPETIAVIKPRVLTRIEGGAISDPQTTFSATCSVAQLQSCISTL